MADIPTPVQARKTEEFSQTQIELVRNALAIADNPFLPDRTYIVFDAVSGSNDLHIDTGGSSTYSINKGEGGLPANFNDTGGTKTLNYTNAGRYLIIIEGNFNGIKVSGTQDDKDKYIAIIAGSNYPTAIPFFGFKSCSNLESAIFPLIISADSDSFLDCTSLLNTYFPLLVTVGQACFSGCTSLKEIDLPLGTTAFGQVFLNNTSLESVNLPSATTIANNFSGCIVLRKVILTSLTSIATNAFNGCSELEEIDIRLVVTIGQNAFKDCVKLRKMHVSSAITFSGLLPMESVILTDLYVDGDLDQANIIASDIVTAGGLFTNNSRLIYDNSPIPTFSGFTNIGIRILKAITGGIITITNSNVGVSGEGSVADELDTINGGSEGTLLILSAFSEAITVTENGNIKLSVSTRVLNSSNDRLMLHKGTITWNEVSYSDNN